jgi:putative oxidoreductase
MKNKILSTWSLNTDVAALLLRLIFGGLFIYHGYDKIDHYHMYLSMSKDIIGIGTKLSFNLVIFAEFFCGFFVAIGFLTRLTVIPIFISMSVAFFVAHAKDAFMVKELAFLFLLLCIPIFILGSGKYSVDTLVFKKKNS